MLNSSPTVALITGSQGALSHTLLPRARAIMEMAKARAEIAYRFIYPTPPDCSYF